MVIFEISDGQHFKIFRSKYIIYLYYDQELQLSSALTQQSTQPQILSHQPRQSSYQTEMNLHFPCKSIKHIECGNGTENL